MDRNVAAGQGGQCSCTLYSNSRLEQHSGHAINNDPVVRRFTTELVGFVCSPPISLHSCNSIYHNS